MLPVVLSVILIIIIILVIILLLVILTRQKKRRRLEIVIARYEEDLSWIEEEPFLSLLSSSSSLNMDVNVILYNKGSPIISPPRFPIQIKTLPNVGRCDHTFLHHIVQHYSEWNKETIVLFLPATCMENHKRERTQRVLQAVLQTQDTVLCGPVYSREQCRDFQLAQWKATSWRNYLANNETYLLPADPRPLGKWLDTYVPDRPIPVYTFYSIFAVHTRHILQHPLQQYQDLLATVDHHSNPEAGHYLERAWSAIFYPYPSSCIHYQ